MEPLVGKASRFWQPRFLSLNINKGRPMDITGIGSVFDFLGKAADKIWPNADEANKAKFAMFQAQQAGELKGLEQEFELAKSQIAVNAIDAASPSLLNSGGRPACIWIGAFSMAYVSIIEPVARFVATVCFHYTGAFPVIDTSLTMQVMFGLLGLSGMRSYDKKQGTASK
jgi:Holin of 3TMs, for gene-transfer release